MLDFIKEKRGKKHPDVVSPESNGPILSPSDEHFLQKIVSEASDSDSAPQLPDRPGLAIAGDTTGNDRQLVVGDNQSDDSSVEQSRGLDPTIEGGHGSEETEHKHKSSSSRFAFLKRGNKKDRKTAVSADEAAKEQDDISKILDDLSLEPDKKNKRVFSMSDESQKLVQQFTLILKDLVNGVPTAYDDLVSLFDNSQGQLQKIYSHLPSYLQKLVEKLPEKFAQNLGTEAMATASATAAESSAFGTAAAGSAAKKAFKIPSLKDIVTKQGAIAGLLKAIMNFLKLRWPAFMGTSVLWSLGIFILMLVFWYCHKRGREVRLAKEKKAAEGIDHSDRFEELPDDPMLPAPSASTPDVAAPVQQAASASQATGRE